MGGKWGLGQFLVFWTIIGCLWYDSDLSWWQLALILGVGTAINLPATLKWIDEHVITPMVPTDSDHELQHRAWPSSPESVHRATLAEEDEPTVYEGIVFDDVKFPRKETHG